MSSTAFDRLLEEFQLRWMRGQSIKAEDFIGEHPDHDWSDEKRLDVIYAEVLLREESGESPSLDDYLQRFPDLSDAIQVQWDVHSSMASLLDTESPDRLATHPESGQRPGGLPCAPDGFELIRQIGRGGSGVVYLARDQRLNRSVAIKFLDTSSAEMQAKLEREAQLLARVSHPGILPVYAVGTVNGKCWMAVEYASGGSVRDTLRGRVLDAETAAGLMLAVSRAAGAAHTLGIVHCDLNPGNLLLTSPVDAGQELRDLGRAEIRITDFGLARALDVAVTSTTSIEGTFLYMSPEQGRAERESICPGSDVYSLGATLYELLTGRPPFTGSHPAEILEQLFHSSPTRPRDLRYGIPVDLETICLKCLEKSPAARYANGNELADDLQRFLEGHAVLARPISSIERFRRWSQRNRRLSLAVMSSFLLLVIGVGTTSAAALVASRYRKKAEEQATLAKTEAETSRQLASEAKMARISAESAQKKAEQTAAENQRFSDNLVQMIYSADPRLTKRQWTVSEMIIATSEKPEFWQDLSEEHAFRLRLAFARSLMGAARQKKAVPLFKQCLEYANAHLAAGDPLVLDIKRDLAVSISETDPELSVVLLREIVAEERFAASDRRFAQLKLAEMILIAGRTGEAEAELDTLISTLSAVQPVDHMSMFRARMLQARILYGSDRAEAALPLCLELCKTIPSGMSPFAALEPTIQLAECYSAMNRPQDAVGAYREVLPKLIEIGGPAHMVSVDTSMSLLIEMLAADDPHGVDAVLAPYVNADSTLEKQPPFILMMMMIRVALESTAEVSTELRFEDKYSMESILQQMFASTSPAVVSNLKCVKAMAEHLKRKHRDADVRRICELSLLYLQSAPLQPEELTSWKSRFESLTH